MQLAMRQLCSSMDAADVSHQSRLLLSQLSNESGFHLDPAIWSGRGEGQPTHPDMPAGWHASISHRHARVVVALANCPIGIDLEVWQQRHTARLNKLVQLLPEAAIRQQIQQSDNPQRSFYKAYTLHEALYKLSTAIGKPVAGMFDTRISDIQPSGELFAWYWEDEDWFLSVAADADIASIEVPRIASLKTARECNAVYFKVCRFHSITHTHYDKAMHRN